MSQDNEWLSLGDAAEILGVHPSTVRHWADSGDLPSQRTPGGHRRFRRSDLERWSSKREPNVAPTEARLMMQNALGRTRMEISEGQLRKEAWHASMSEEARKAHRQLGQHLLEILTTYLADPDESSNVQADVRELGVQYATISKKEGVSLTDSVRAFLFFRDLVIDSVIQLAEMLSLHTPLDWSNGLKQVHVITDELLLALIEEYQK